MKRHLLSLTLLMALLLSNVAMAQNGRWSEKKANDWFKKTGWLVGANFNASTTINQLEMWQADTFDPETIDRELGWAADLGFNSMRVYLHDLPWKEDPAGYIGRLEKYLEIADSHGIKTMFVIFDAVWHPYPVSGKQPEPTPHVHNSGWVQSPGALVLRDPDNWGYLEEYVKDLVGHFANDERVVVWDVFNEPDNTNDRAYGDIELKNKVEMAHKLTELTFKWAREVNPSQPLTAAIWNGDWSKHENMRPIEKMMIEQSDIITFHSYDTPEILTTKIAEMKRYNRPVLCTEYMARPRGSTFESYLPIMKDNQVGAYNWGFVAGKSQTIYPWDSWDRPYTAEPEPWFHDIFRQDGTPYMKSEVDLIKKLTGVSR